MAYKWKPSKTQARAFAEKMNNDSAFAADYEKRKTERADKRRATSQFDYEKAGGNYVPTKFQHDIAFEILSDAKCSTSEIDAANMVIFGYTTSKTVQHDYIHVVNEYSRNK